jgi:hypothetical protein
VHLSEQAPIVFPSEDGDDPHFLHLVRLLIAAELKSLAPPEFFLVRIDNWFDDKWLRYSEMRRKSPYAYATFPPFTPARVLKEWHFVRESSDGYALAPAPRTVHDCRRKQRADLQRRAGDFSPSALFVWFSSNSQVNGRGSLMVYRSNDSHVTSRYVSFDGNHDWRPSRAKGIALAQLTGWVQAKVSI